ncbi:hypothetical protein Cgig2_020470 [Carnegiea gigantea]|uniref:Uncharacterized protein n=1 Tax=Carnegiea gigantea TaxID=171969 RepID=A0A9Q1JNN5_9CARY|nr:hypothetical protein Cgig2_020470 [Carnegiea gigantea]
MATFSDESYNKRQYLCIRLGNKDVKETKVQIRKPIAHFSKSKCHEGLPSFPSWLKENLKMGEIFLLSSHPDAQESVPSYHLLHHDIDAKQKPSEKLPFQGQFSYTPLYWEWLEDGWNESHAVFDELGVPKDERTYPVGHSKRKKDSSSNQNIQRDEGPSGSKPKLKIVHSQKPLRSPILETEDNTPQTRIPGVRATISFAPIPAIPIQSVAMPAKAPDEVRLTPKPSPATACRQKLKSIVVCTPDEQGISNIQESKLNYEKTICPPPDSTENIMDILNCNPSPTECMDFLGNDLCPNDSKSICTLNDDDEADFTPKADAARVPPPLRPSRASQDVSVFNVDAIIREVNKNRARMTVQVILDKVFRTPFERLHYLKGEFDSLYNLINERGGDATPLKDKVERLIH